MTDTLPPAIRRAVAELRLTLDIGSLPAYPAGPVRELVEFMESEFRTRNVGPVPPRGAILRKFWRYFGDLEAIDGAVLTRAIDPEDGDSPTFSDLFDLVRALQDAPHPEPSRVRGADGPVTWDDAVRALVLAFSCGATDIRDDVPGDVDLAIQTAEAARDALVAAAYADCIRIVEAEPVAREERGYRAELLHELRKRMAERAAAPPTFPAPAADPGPVTMIAFADGEVLDVGPAPEEHF